MYVICSEAPLLLAWSATRALTIDEPDDENGFQAEVSVESKLSIEDPAVAAASSSVAWPGSVPHAAASIPSPSVASRARTV